MPSLRDLQELSCDLSPSRWRWLARRARRRCPACPLPRADPSQQGIPANALLTDYVRTVIRTPPDSGHYDPFYGKYTEAEGLPITASEKVPDAAILAARNIIIHMLSKRPDVRREMIAQKLRVTVMAQVESTTDVPEQRNWKKPALCDPRLTDGERANCARIATMTDQQYWNARARGMGGRLTSSTMPCACSSACSGRPRRRRASPRITAT